MPRIQSWTAALALLLLAPLAASLAGPGAADSGADDAPAPLAAFTASAQAHAHIGHVMESFGNTPNGNGLLPTAVSEAEIAAQHASLSARADGLEMMKTHARHVLHAVDPSQIDGGPGLGYGVKQAAQGVATHIELAAGSDDASGAVQTHSTHVAAAARSTARRADEIVSVLEEIRAAGSASAARPLVEEMRTLAQQLISGADANGDGSVSWQSPEGGLEQARTHMNLMMEAEGMGR